MDKVLIHPHRVLHFNNQNAIMAEERRQILVLHSVRQFVLSGKASRYKTMFIHPGPMLSFDQKPAFKSLNDDIFRAELHNIQQDLKACVSLLLAAGLGPGCTFHILPPVAQCCCRRAWQSIQRVIQLVCFQVLGSKLLLIAYRSFHPVSYNSFCHC